MALQIDLSYLQTEQFKKAHTIRAFELDKLHISAKIASENQLALIKRKCWKNIFRPVCIKEKNFRFNPNVLHVRQNCILDGFWQCEKYFINIKEILFEEFTFQKTISDIDLQKIQTEIQTTNSVSIHFRRGDYLSNNNANKSHGVCSMEYYQKAVQFIAEKVNDPVFFVFSDDIEWVKDNFKCEFPVHYIEKSDENIHSDFQLMSLCKHNIVANSSYSWWAAWLNRNEAKLVIAPKRWFADEKNQSQAEDLIPQSWIKI